MATTCLPFRDDESISPRLIHSGRTNQPQIHKSLTALAMSNLLLTLVGSQFTVYFLRRCVCEANIRRKTKEIYFNHSFGKGGGKGNPPLKPPKVFVPQTLTPFIQGVINSL